MNKQSSQHSKERGGVMVIILVAVSLFAALGYVVTDMMNQGNPEHISERRAELLAGEILDYSRSIRQGIQAMRISNGCTDDGISFTVNSGDSYEYATPVADECKVFHVDGGGRNYVPAAEQWLSDRGTTKTFYGEWLFEGRHCIDNIGSTVDPCVDANIDLLMILPHIKKNICLAINDAVNVTNTGGDAPTENHDNPNNGFVGTYVSGTNSLLDTPELSGRNSGCFRDFTGPWQDSYIFYQVLRAR